MNALTDKYSDEKALTDYHSGLNTGLSFSRRSGGRVGVRCGGGIVKKSAVGEVVLQILSWPRVSRETTTIVTKIMTAESLRVNIEGS